MPERLGVSPYSLYAQKKKFAKASSAAAEKDFEIRRLKKELVRVRVSEERDILNFSHNIACKVLIFSLTEVIQI